MTHLRQRMIEDMGIRNLADNTQSAYLQQILSYAEHFHCSPEKDFSRTLNKQVFF